METDRRTDLLYQYNVLHSRMNVDVQ